MINDVQRERRIEELRSSQFRHLREARDYIKTELLELGPGDGEELEQAQELSSRISAIVDEVRERLDDSR